jgi:hypothetical protein
MALYEGCDLFFGSTEGYVEVINVDDEVEWLLSFHGFVCLGGGIAYNVCIWATYLYAKVIKNPPSEAGVSTKTGELLYWGVHE